MAEADSLDQRIAALKEEIAKLESENAQVAKETTTLEAQEVSLKAEIVGVQKSLHRATQLRQACARLSSVDEKFRTSRSSVDRPNRKGVGEFPEKKQLYGPVAFGSLAVLTASVLLAAGVINVSLQEYCTPKIRTSTEKDAKLTFHPFRPPLLNDGVSTHNQSKTVQWGAAALHVCARGTSEVSFLRRDDCDGCLCPTGSVWVHYKDPRFFGNGAFCVPESEWKTCISKWSCCAHKPNLCWDFIFGGARHDPNKTQSAVLVDTCSQHMSCYVLIKRYRKWELVSEQASHEDDMVMEPLEVGVDPAEIALVNQTLHMTEGIRGWGMPSSVLHLIKVTVSTAPQEWKAKQTIDVERSYRAGALNRIWQLVSHYKIVAKGMSGDEYTLAAWEQREWNSYHDSQ